MLLGWHVFLVFNGRLPRGAFCGQSLFKELLILFDQHYWHWLQLDCAHLIVILVDIIIVQIETIFLEWKLENNGNLINIL
jgi:hypothetical protein